MIFITSNNANVLTFLFKETDTLIAVKKAINPFTYLLKFNSLEEEENFTRVIDERNNTNYDLYMLMLPDFNFCFRDYVGTITIANVSPEHILNLEPGHIDKEKIYDTINKTEEEQLDELLDKVSRVSYNGLTESEKTTLNKLSK